MLEKKLSFRPVRQSGSLTAEIAKRLAADITQGKLVPGERLPTEQEMMAAMGVSRTVVREAVAALRAEGLVTTRQGVGAFVADEPLRHPFRIEPEQVGSLAEVLNVMELRAAVETEAAGLAAERATKAQTRAIEAALRSVDRAIAQGEAAVSEDFALHSAIAAATGNPQFLRFLDYLGRFIIPRQSIRVASDDLPGYLATIQDEHRAIVAAIAARASDDAQAAMRAHLLRSRERYRSLAPARGRAATPKD